MNPQVTAITNTLTPPPAGTANGYVAPSNTNDAIMQQLQSQNSNISSSESDIQSQYTAAIQQLQTGGAAQQVAIQNKYNPLIANQQLKNQQAAEGGLENNHGYGLNAALLQTINKQSDDDMQTLVQERDSALATGQAETAKSVSDLMVKALEDKAANTQAVFKNLLDIAGYKQTADRNAADIANQQFNQQTTLTDLAAKYGVTVDPGETPQTLANKIAPIASKEEKMKMDLELAQIYEAHANGQRAIAEANAANTKTAPAKLQAIADSINIYGGIHSQGGQALLASLKDASDQAQVISLASQAQSVQTVQNIYVANGVSKTDAQADLMKQFKAGTVSAAEFTFLSGAVDVAYKGIPEGKSPTYKTGGFTPPGTYGPGGLGSVKPFPPASAEAVAALNKALQGTAFR